MWINGSKRFSRGGANCFNDYRSPFAKFGIYKYPWKTQKSPSSPHGARVGPVKSRLAWHDEVYECKEGKEGHEDSSPLQCGYEAVEPKPELHTRNDGPVPILPQCATLLQRKQADGNAANLKADDDAAAIANLPAPHIVQTVSLAEAIPNERPAFH